MIRVPGIGLHLPTPSDMGWEYAGTQALDHYSPRDIDFIDNRVRLGHRHDAEVAVNSIALPYRQAYKDMGDLRMLAALVVAMSDSAHAEAEAPRASYQVLREIGKVGVLLNAGLEQQTRALSAPNRTNKAVAAFPRLAADVLLMGGMRTPVEGLDAGGQLVAMAAMSGASWLLTIDSRSAKLRPDLAERRRPLIEPVITEISERLPRHFGGLETLDKYTPAEDLPLAQNAQLLGAATFELSAVVAGIHDNHDRREKISYDNTRKIARRMGMSGILLRHLTTVHEDLRNGVLTLATVRVAAAARDGGISRKFLRSLRDEMHDRSAGHRVAARELAVNKDQEGVVKALTAEMCGKLEYNTFRHDDHWVTPRTVRAAYQQSPFKKPV